MATTFKNELNEVQDKLFGHDKRSYRANYD